MLLHGALCFNFPGVLPTGTLFTHAGLLFHFLPYLYCQGQLEDKNQLDFVKVACLGPSSGSPNQVAGLMCSSLGVCWWTWLGRQTRPCDPDLLKGFLTRSFQVGAEQKNLALDGASVSSSCRLEPLWVLDFIPTPRPRY